MASAIRGILLSSFNRKSLLCAASYNKPGIRHYKRYLYPYLQELYNRRLKAGVPEEVPRNKQLNWNYDAELHAFSHRISELVPRYTLQLAFVDRSYALQMKKLELELNNDTEDAEKIATLEEDIFSCNEQLSESGGRFTRRYIEEYLVSQLPHLPGEGIQALLEYLMSTAKLAHIGNSLGMNELILYDGYPIPDEAVVKSVLAVIAIIKDEHGVSKAQGFIRDFIITQLIGEDIDDIYHIKNGMTQLEDLLAKQEKPKPVARLIDQFGQETLVACYYVGVYSGEELIGQAGGETPEIAQEMAARDALMTIYGIQDNKLPFDFDETYRQKMEGQSRDFVKIANSTPV